MAAIARTTHIEELKFGDKDLSVLGTLEFGQYGVVSGHLLCLSR